MEHKGDVHRFPAVCHLVQRLPDEHHEALTVVVGVHRPGIINDDMNLGFGTE